MPPAVSLPRHPHSLFLAAACAGACAVVQVEVEVLFTDVQAGGGSGLVPAGASARAQEAGPVRSAPLPAGPEWERGPEAKGAGEWKAYSKKHQRINAGMVAQANASATWYDLVLYGDSLTWYIEREGFEAWHTRYFSPANGWGPTAAIGVGGNELADLMWRLAEGGEVPAIDPKVVVLLVGINDLFAHHPLDQTAQRMAFLLDWLRAGLPRSRLVLLALLPNAGVDTAHMNERYARVAAQRGVTFLPCAQSIDPHDKYWLYDGTHPKPPAQEELMRCLEPAAKALLAQR